MEPIDLPLTFRGHPDTAKPQTEAGQFGLSIQDTQGLRLELTQVEPPETED